MNKKKIANLSSLLLIVAVLACLLSRVLLFFVDAQAEFTKYYILAMVYTYGLYAAVGLAVVWAVLNWRILKELVRKLIVSLKRQPSVIPLLMLLASFLYYSLNLTDVSNTTALVQGKGMGLAQFCIMLVNMLCMLCMLNAFPRRKKANVPMVVLVYVMLAVLLYCSSHYMDGVYAAITREVSPINPTTEKNLFVAYAYNMLANYRIMIVVTAVLTATLPLYSKLIRKIKTSVAVEDNGNMAQIEIED